MWCAVAALMWFANLTSPAHSQGVELYKQQKYSEAIAVLEGAAKDEPVNSDEYRESALLIGQSYFMISMSPKAIPWLERVPATTESSYMLGYAYQQAGEDEKSVAAFARLFGVDPKSAAAHLLTGQMLIKRQLEDKGAEEVKKAISIDPKIPEAYFLLGEVAMFRGNVEESIADLKQEISINPNFSMAWYRLGDAYTRLEKWEDAIPALQRSIWLNQNFSAPYILLGKCYSKKDDLVNAEKFLKQALELDPKNYSATFLLGKVLIAGGKAEEGRAMLEKSRSLPH